MGHQGKPVRKEMGAVYRGRSEQRYGDSCVTEDELGGQTCPRLQGGRPYEAGALTKPEGNNSQETFSVHNLGDATSRGPNEKEKGEIIFKNPV